MIKKEGDMYSDPQVVSVFVKYEQNYRHKKVAELIEEIILLKLKKIKDIHIAELGGGAHIDRYHNLFKKLLKNPIQNKIDWVDISPYMIEEAKNILKDEKYSNRNELIKFIEIDILEYLLELDDNSLDFAIMKYTFDHLENIEKLIMLLSKKLKKDGMFIATLTSLSPDLKSISPNAKYYYNDKPIPLNQTQRLKDGDKFMIKFFKDSDDHNKGFIPGAQVYKYYHSEEKIKKIANKHNLKIISNIKQSWIMNY